MKDAQILIEELISAPVQMTQRTVVSQVLCKASYPLLTRPYTREEVREFVSRTGGLIGAVIELDLSDAIERREDEFYGLLGEKLIGEAEELNDITWQVIGAQSGYIHLLVTADARGWLAEINPAYIEQQSRHPNYAA